ncbi:MAG: lysyl endopeptidase [Ulvibacter sp.]|jgi:hypothetical protein
MIKFFKSSVLIGILCFVFQVYAHSQVRTSILEHKKDFLKIVKQHNSGSTKELKVKKPDIDSFLKKDEREGQETSRVAVNVDVDYDKGAGKFFSTEESTNWKVSFDAQQATSLSFKFENLNLPKGSEMYIYSDNKRMVMGPIKNINVHDGNYMTDMIYGEKVTIEVILPNKVNASDFSINVERISYGIQSNIFSNDSRFYGDSAPCNNDINCTVGNGWSDVRNGVAMIIRDGARVCSGSLVSDGCESGRSYFLTAFHCFAGNSTSLSKNDKKDIEESSTYRFFYESPTCDGPDATTWTTINGAEFRSGSATTDFLLVELLEPTTGIAKNNVNPGSFTNISFGCIHHPKGDVKKISIDNDPLDTSGTNFFIIEDWDDGLVQGGSSGGPLFDFSHNIIGIVSAGPTGVSCTSPIGGSTLDNGTYGRMDASWMGDGTNSTSLEPWLGNNLPPDFALTNHLDSLNNISGPSVMCRGQQAAFCATSNTGSSGYSWSVSPTDMFTSSTSGTGTCATLEVDEDYMGNGWATLSFTGNFPVYGTCTSSGTITKKIWIGLPEQPSLNLPACFNKRTNISISVEGDGATTYTWEFPSCPFVMPPNDPHPDCWFNYDGNTSDDQINIYVGQQTGSISVWATNACGTTSVNVPINFCDPQEEGPGPHIRNSHKSIIKKVSEVEFDLYPNPASDFVIVRSSGIELKSIEILSSSGQIISNIIPTGNETVLKTEWLQTGLYFIKVSNARMASLKKLFIVN